MHPMHKLTPCTQRTENEVDRCCKFILSFTDENLLRHQALSPVDSVPGLTGFMRDQEEALTHLLTHEVLYPYQLPSSSTVLQCTNLTASNGLCSWSRGLQDPCPKSLFCSQTMPWNKLLAVVLGFPRSDLGHVQCTFPSASHGFPPSLWQPWSLFWHRAAKQQEFLHPQSWHWFLRHPAAQRTQPAIVLTHLSLLQSQRHPNWSVLQHHYVYQPELPFTFHLPP